MHRKAPCRSCPWRRDVPPGAFGCDRYAQLANTSTSDGIGPQLADPLFACHLTVEGAEQACAGWLAVEGHRHPAVRLAAAAGRLPWEALEPLGDWPVLFDSFTEMVRVQAGPA